MGSERLVILSDPSTFKVMDVHKYFQDFTKFIESNMANDLFSQLNKSSFEKVESLAILDSINFVNS
jgi:hypothetical protein